MTAEQVKEVALAVGADIVGIGAMDRFEGAPLQNDPRYIFPEAKAIIGLGFRIHRGRRRVPRQTRDWHAKAFAGHGFYWRDSGSAKHRTATGWVCTLAWQLHTIVGCHYRCAYCSLWVLREPADEHGGVRLGARPLSSFMYSSMDRPPVKSGAKPHRSQMLGNAASDGRAAASS